MNQQTALLKIAHFFLTKIIIGITVVGGSVVFIEWAGRLLLDLAKLTDNSENNIISILEAVIALISYIFLFRFYEKRQIKELSLSAFGKNAIIGFATGLTLQSLFILIIYIAAVYSIININPLSFTVPGLMEALTAGFVAELVLCGIIFRLTE